jgi:hypothetical protein
MINMETKLCPKCHEDKTYEEYLLHKSGKLTGQPMAYCKNCTIIYQHEWYVTHPGYHLELEHIAGRCISKDENKSCPKYLGEVIAERVLAGLFEHVEKAPMNNPGWDFICGKKKRIDCKSSCLRHGTYSNSYWSFHICKNIICDYFLCLAFDDRDSLNPLHVWLIPGELINDKKSISITNTDMSLVKWKQYEKPIDNVLTCCSKLRQINEYRM